MTAQEKPNNELLPHEKKCQELMQYLSHAGFAVVIICYNTKSGMQQSCQNFQGVQGIIDMLEGELKHIREKETH
jgi:hypothetical protein